MKQSGQRRNVLKVAESRETAAIIPFPLIARAAFIERLAERLAAMPTSTAEKHLRAALRLQERTLAKRQLPPNTIETELASLHTAIRAKVAQIMGAA